MRERERGKETASAKRKKFFFLGVGWLNESEDGLELTEKEIEREREGKKRHQQRKKLLGCFLVECVLRWIRAY